MKLLQDNNEFVSSINDNYCFLNLQEIYAVSIQDLVKKLIQECGKKITRCNLVGSGL